MTPINKTVFLSLFVLSAIVLTGCDGKNKFPVNYEFGAFPDSVINFESVNSSYDDYNSAGPPTISYRMMLMFSTNRYSEGRQFDLVDYEVLLQFNQTDGIFGLYSAQGMYPFFYLTELARSDKDEFGPSIVQITNMEFLTLFSSNRTGDMEIYTNYWTEDILSGVVPTDAYPFRLEGVNSDGYDAYPTINAEFSEMLFCSDRDGNLDLYRVTPPGAAKMTSWIKLADTTYLAEPVEHLNSDLEDACPYINGNLLVFASKRAGGYGGYDLYYATRDDQEWSDPINFGPKINTASNEFRPIVVYAQLFENDLMVFSSDRPGGKGGYDLYYTGIPAMIND